VCEQIRRGSWEGVLRRVGSRALEVLPNRGLELLECAGLGVELPLEAGACLVFHLVDLPKGEYTLTDDALDLQLEYVSPQTTLEAIANAETKRRCPEEPRAAMSQVFQRRLASCDGGRKQ
jgi:hypothetical protein